MNINDIKLFKRVISLKKYRFMLQQLVNRDFKVRYRGSFLGMLWSVLNPLLNMMVLSIVFSQVFKAVDNYKMYLLSGIIIFNFFSEATNLAVNSIVSNFGLITKIYFPKFILPLSKTLSSSINLILTFMAFLLIGNFMNVKLWWGYLFIIYLFICILIFTAGVSFILSSMQVFMRDVQHVYTVITTIWMYSTPILYPIEIIPEQLQILFKANPLYIFIDFFRTIVLNYSLPSAYNFLSCAVVSAISFALGLLVFWKCQNKFIYYS